MKDMFLIPPAGDEKTVRVGDKKTPTISGEGFSMRLMW